MKGRGLAALLRREWATVWTHKAAYRERVVYALLLFLGCEGAWGVAMFSGELKPWEYAAFAHSIFGWFFAGQFILASLLATVLCSRAVTREKEGGTLDLFLMAPLTGFEIFLGKMAGQLLGVFVLLICGIPVLFFLLPMGGVSALEVLSIHLVLVGHLLAVTGLCALLSAWFQGPAPVMAFSWIAMFGAFLLPWVGREIWPAYTVYWVMLDAANPWTYVDRELSGVGLQLGEACGVVVGGAVVLLACCAAGGVVLRGRQKRVAAKELSKVRVLVKKVRSGRASGVWSRLLRPLLPMRHPLVLRECSLEHDPAFRRTVYAFILMILLGSVLLFLLSGMGRQRVEALHVVGAFVAVIAGGVFSIMHGAISLALDRKRGTLEAWLAANAEPEDIVRAKIGGSLLRAGYLIVIPLVYLIVGVMVLGPRELSAFLIIPAIAGLVVGLMTSVLLGMWGSMFTKGGVIGVVLVHLVAIGVGSLAAMGVAISVAVTWLTLLVVVAVWGALSLSLYAFTVRRLRRWVLGAA